MQPPIKASSSCSAAGLFAVYVLCMFALYSFMPVVMEMTSATAVNLALLTADLFSLFCGLFLFHYRVSDSSAVVVSLTPSGLIRIFVVVKTLAWLLPKKTGPVC